jgi:transitional endoplasmic reticulum ATPase
VDLLCHSKGFVPLIGVFIYLCIINYYQNNLKKTMDKDFEIKFGKSSSPMYLEAIKMAKKFSDFTPIGEISNFNIIRPDKNEIYNKFRVYESLYSLICNWKSTVVTYQNQHIEKYTYNNLLGIIIRCSKRYQESYDKEHYCNLSPSEEGWGCKFLTDMIKHLESNRNYYPNRNYWYKFGRFESDKVWKIDKKIIHDYLEREVESRKIYHCPIFSLETAYKYVDQLPDTIDLNLCDDWEIVYQEVFQGTDIQSKPISIRHIRKENETIIGQDLGINQEHYVGEDFGAGVEIRLSVPDGLFTDIKHPKRYIPDVTFEDIGGIDEIIEQIREVIELPLKRPEFYQHLGVKPHRGVLLYGEPGNGKTLIAKAIANEVKAHFIPISGPELLNKYYGQSEENLRNVFKEARELQPSIICCDEIDSIAQKRTDDESGRIDSKFVNQLLTLMDGMESHGNVTVLASTNRPELIDTALLRPGRFDYKIEIKNPDEIGCYKIFMVATRKMPLDDNFEINRIIPRLLGCSGAEIVFITQEAAIIALRRTVNLKDIIIEEERSNVNLNQLKVNREDFIHAIEKLRINEINKK